MKRIHYLVFLAVLFFSYSYSNAQNPHCTGLKNPTNFIVTGGTANSLWTGYTGTKQGTASTCYQIGSTFGTTVQASQLESITGGGSNCYFTSMNPVDIHGNADKTRRFVIKGPGNDPYTNNQLS